jgi:heme/copper-type cytochrome/quinol oxidase subunit 1
MNFDIFSTNLKGLSRQYLWVGFLFFLLGYGSIFFVRPYLTPTGDAYIKFEEMHGTVCVFFGIVPMAFVSLGYYIMPLPPGSRMYFPRLDLIGLVLFYLSSVVMLLSLFVPGRFVWILAMSLNIPFALICSANFIATIFHLSYHGLRWTQMRSVVWSLFVTAFFVLFSFSLLEFAAVMQLANAFSDSNFWLASPLPINSEPMSKWWKHAFWFLGHPEVYILMLLILGFVTDRIGMLLRNSVNSV